MPSISDTNQASRGEWTSASSAEADAACAGRFLASRGLPEQQSDVADRGTRVHAWLHWKRTKNDHMPPLLEDDAELDLALRCWDLEQEEKRLWLESIGGDGNEVIECLSEHRQWVNCLEWKHSGQADAIYRLRGHTAMFDTKSGFLEVTPPNENLQLRDLAALENGRPAVQTVTVQIIRPFGKRQPQCVYDHAALERAWKEMRQRVLCSLDPNSPRTPNELSCRYCKARGREDRCPESTQAVVTLSQTAQELIARPTAEFLDACKLVMGIAKQAQQNAKALLSVDPDAIPGYTLEPNEPMRPIIDAQEAWRRAQASGISLEQFMATVKVGKDQLAALLKARHRELTNRDRIPHGEWSSILNDFYAGILGETEKEPSLKRLAAGRDARNEEGTPRTPEDGSNPSASTISHGTT